MNWSTELEEELRKAKLPAPPQIPEDAGVVPSIMPPEPSWADEMSDDIEEDKRFRSLIKHASRLNPDQTAKDQATAKRHNIPLDIVEGNRDDISAETHAFDVADQTADAPHTRAFLRNPDNAKVAHDDVKNLTALEFALKFVAQPIIDFGKYSIGGGSYESAINTLKAIPAGIAVGSGGLLEGALRAPNTVLRMKEAAGLDMTSDLMQLSAMGPLAPILAPAMLGMPHLEKGTFGLGTSEAADAVGDLMETAGEEYEAIARMHQKAHHADRALKELLEGNPDPMADVLTDPEAVAGFVAQAVPSLVLAWASGGSMPFMMFLESLEVANDAAEFEERTGQKIDPLMFTVASAQAGVVGGLLEKIGFSAITKKLGSGPLTNFLGGALGEMTTEGLQAFNSNLAIWATYNSQQELTAGIVPGMIGGFGAGGGGSLISAMGKASDADSDFTANLVRAQRAIDSQLALDKAVAALEGGKLLDRDKEKVRQFIEGQLGAEDSVFLSPEDAAPFFQSHADVLEEMPEEVRAPIVESLEMGSEVAIPKAAYLAYYTDFHAEIRDMIRNDIDGMNAQEVAIWSKKAQGDFEVAAERELTKMDLDAEFRASADKIQTSISEQLVRAGMTPDIANAYASMHKVFAMSAAKRMGITPEEVYEKFGLRVQRQDVVPEELQEAFNQTAADVGLFVGMRKKDGTIIRGERGQIHAQLLTTEVIEDQGIEFEFGFVDEEGKFYTRKEAEDLVINQFASAPENIGQARGREISGGLRSETKFWQSPLSEYLQARAKGLDMSKEARMERAREMGFDTETVWYHGTAATDIREFDSGNRAAISFTQDPEFAERFAEVDEADRAEFGDAATIYPVLLRAENTFDLRKKEHREKVGLTDEDADADYQLIEYLAPEIQEAGFDSYIDYESADDTPDSIAVFDPSQIRSINAAFDPDFETSADLLAQGPNLTRWNDYKAEQEARPIKDQIAEPIRRKDGTYRVNAQGDITGAPIGVKTEEDIREIVAANVANMESELAQMPDSAEWYEVSGQAIRDVTNGDPQLAEDMVRMMAVLSATNNVGGNTTGAIKAIYQLARGEVAAAGRFPNKFREISQQIIDAKDITFDVPGVDSKVMSFYRNLWDATFESTKYENAVTMDMWMARLFGYQLDTFGPAQYRFASMVTNQIREQYNAKHGTELLNRQVQAALWVYSRNRDKFGEAVGADITLPDRAAFDTYIERAKQHITLEAVPATDSGLFPEIYLASPEQRGEFTRQAMGLLLNSNGENELFKRIGIPLYEMRPSEGSFMGEINPNEILSVVSDKISNKVDMTKADLAARALQYIYTQNAVPWIQFDHTATGKNVKQGVAIYMKEAPSTEIEESLLEHIRQTVDADFTRVGNDLFLLNFNIKSKDNPDGITNAKFKQQVLQAVNTYREQGGLGAELIEDVAGNVKARSNYLGHLDPEESAKGKGLDWSDQVQVEALEDAIRDSGGPDLLRWARDRREAVAALSTDFRDENLEALYQAPGVAPFDLAFDHIVVDATDLTIEGKASNVRRAKQIFEEASRGEAPLRRPPSVRREADGSYTVLDGRSATIAAMEAGYNQIPVRVIDDVRDDDGNVVKVSPEVEDYYNKAARVKDQFDWEMEQIAERLGGVWKGTNLKGRKRAQWKVDNEYNGDPSGLKDVLRGTISVNTLDDVRTAQSLISQAHKPKKNKAELLNIHGVNLNGYKDLNMVIEIDGVMVEVQVNTREMLVAKHFGHDLYDAYRQSKNYDLVEDMLKIEQKMYRDAYAMTKQRAGKGTIEDALRVVRARLSDVAEVNERYGLSINFLKSDFETFAPLWAAEPGGKFRGGSVSHAKQALLAKSNVTGMPSTSSSSAVSGIASTSLDTSFTSDSIVTDRKSSVTRMGGMEAIPGLFREIRGLFSQQNRGQIQFTEEGGLITLLGNADLSTFLHESGHFFFEAYKVLARENDAIRADMDVLLDFVGVGSLDQWEQMSINERRAGHEKVAEAFERYLFEGKAPSLELQPLFDRFRSWLLEVYKNLRNLNAPLTDEVRQVFDRMLADEAQLQNRQIANNYTALFESEEESGMTPAEWQRYQALNEMRQAASQSALDKRSLRDMQWLSNARSRLLREMQADHKAKRKDMRADVAEEVRKEPVYHSMQFLRTGEATDPDGNQIQIDDHKMNREQFRERYDVSLNLVRGMTDAEGVDIDVLAENLGWSSGDEMVQSILQAEPINERIDRITDQRMLQTYGDLTNPEQMEEAVMEALHSEAHTRFLHTELTHLTKASGVGNVLSRAAKAFAKQAIERKKVKDIKPHQYALAEARAGRLAERAIKRGERDEAAQHKRAQVLNSHFYKAANNAKQDIEKAIRYFKKFNRDGTRKNLDSDYLDQIDKLLEAYDFRQVTQKEIDRRKALSEWVAEQEAMGLSPAIDERLLRDAKRQHYRETPVEELMGLYDSVKNIEHLGRLKHKLIKLQEQRDLDRVATTIRDSIERNAPKRNKNKIEHNSFMDRVSRGFEEIIAMHRKFASMARQMDGADVGPMWEYLIRPMNESGDMEAVEREKATMRMTEIFDPLKKMNLRRKVYIPEINNSLSLEGRIMIALNQGNELNKRRVMTGDGWTQEQVDAILDTLTEEQWNFVQEVWDFIGSYWPQIAEKEKRVKGVVPEKVEATPVTTKFGELPGGYFPIMADSERSYISQSYDEAEIAKQMLRGSFASAMTRRGHVKSRYEGDINRPIRKDFGGIFQHVDQVIHDLSWHEWLVDTQRLLNHPAVANAITERYGMPVLKMFKRAMTDIATGDIPAQNMFETSINHLRQGTTIAGMGWSLWTSALQPLGLTQSIVRIGPKYVGRGIADWFGNASKMESTAKKIFEKSDFMRLRGKTLQREISEIRNTVSSGGRLPMVQNTYFYFIMKLQQVADFPTWLGQYHKAIDQGYDEASAVAQADQAVIDSQSGGQIKDLAQIQRGGPLLKLWTNFYSYFNVTFNLTAESMAKVKRPKDIGRFMVDMALLYTVPATISAIMRDVLMGKCDGDEDCLTEEIARENLSYMLGTVVGVRELSGVAAGFYGYSGPPGTRFFSEMSKLGAQIEQGDADAAFWRAANQSAGILFHYPATQVHRTASGFAAIIEGDVEGVEAVKAPLFGPPR